jgi:hypothetical protein
MEEARKEKAEEIKEKPSKIKKEESKAGDYIDIARELAGLARENYLMGFQLGLSFWERNLKIMNNQIEQWVSVQEEYTTHMRETFDKEAVNFWNGNLKFVNSPVEKMIAIQKDYSNVFINTSDTLMKGAFTVMKDGIDMAFSSFNDYMSQLRGKANGA